MRVFLALFCTLFLFSCSDEESKISNLVVTTGNLSSDTLFIFVQGGPSHRLLTETSGNILSNIDDSSFGKVFIHQAQTLDSMKICKSSITLESAKEINDESVEILHDVVEFYTAQAKVIYLIGVSYGCWLTQEYIFNYGMDELSGVIILAGRLDIQEAVVESNAAGNLTTFEADAITPKPFSSSFFKIQNIAILSSDLFAYRYTERLDGFNDLSKIVYAHGLKDEAVGKLLEYEIQFLKDKNAKVISFDGDHTSTIFELIEEATELVRE